MPTPHTHPHAAPLRPSPRSYATHHAPHTLAGELKLAWGVDEQPTQLPPPPPPPPPPAYLQTPPPAAYMQPTPFQQPGLTQMRATVPMGVYGGQSIMVQTASGPMTVAVPPGYGPGSVFTFNVPSSTQAAPQQPAYQQVMYQQQQQVS